MEGWILRSFSGFVWYFKLIFGGYLGEVSFFGRADPVVIGAIYSHENFFFGEIFPEHSFGFVPSIAVLMNPKGLKVSI